MRHRYLVAVSAAGLASVVRIALNPYWGASLPYILCFPTTLFTALYGGLGAAFAGIAVMSVATMTFVLPPIPAAYVANRLEVMGLAVYIGTGGLVGWLAARHRELWLSAQAQAAELRSSQELVIMATSIVDVTERERAVRTRALLASIVESSQDSIVSVDLNGTITSWNAAAERMLGYRAEEAIGQPITVLCPEEERSGRGPEPWAYDVLHRQAEKEGWRVRKDGSRFWSNEIVTPVHDADGRVIGSARIGRDLSERKASQDALQRAHDGLEVRVRERTAEAQALFERLVSVQEDERRRIARDIHDRLGQQMTALRLGLEVIRTGAAAAQLPHIERSQTIAAALDESIDVLTRQLRPAALDDLGLAAALRTISAGWSEQSSIRVVCDLDENSRVRLSPDAETNLYRVVQEALDNVGRHASATQVRLVWHQVGDELVLVIEDDGRGFDVPHGRNAHGLGLLSMRERALLAGGQLEIETSRGAGTSISVRIPVETRVQRWRERSEDDAGAPSAAHGQDPVGSTGYGC